MNKITAGERRGLLLLIIVLVLLTAYLLSRNRFSSACDAALGGCADVTVDTLMVADGDALRAVSVAEDREGRAKDSRRSARVAGRRAKGKSDGKRPEHKSPPQPRDPLGDILN